MQPCRADRNVKWNPSVDNCLPFSKLGVGNQWVGSQSAFYAKAFYKSGNSLTDDCREFRRYFNLR